MEKRIYDDYDQLVVRCLIEYNFLLEILVRAIGNPKRIIDLGCGTGNLASIIFLKLPDVVIEGVDTSEEFLEIARNKNARYKFRPILADAQKFDLGQCDTECIVSSFTIHHFEDNDKRMIFQKIYQALVPSGVFFNCDMVEPEDNAKVAIENFLARMKKNGFSVEFIEEERREMARRDRLVKLPVQREWLEQVGFEFELLHQNGLFVIYRCKKLSD